jgi:hypothetical protein
MPKLPVSLLITGLLYCRDARVVGQAGEVMNLVDLALLPVSRQRRRVIARRTRVAKTTPSVR